MKQHIQAAVNGRAAYEQFAYFFKNNQYIKYDWANDKPVDGYPQPLGAWNFPAAFASGVDAAVNGWGNSEGKAYFFKGNQYLRYNWATGLVDDGYPMMLSEWHLPDGFNTAIDAALEGRGNYSNKIYFFKGGQYVRYDMATDSPDAGYPAPLSAWNLPEPFASGFDTVLNGNGAFKDFAYFFKGNQYIRYSWTTEQPDGGVKDLSSWALAFAGAASGNLPFADKVTENKDSFLNKVAEVAAALNIPPKWLMGIMYSESGLNHRIVNPNGGAVGLIQFMPDTVKRVLKTTPEHLVSITNVEQMDYVHQFYKGGRFTRMTDMYLYTFYPAALGRGDDFVIGSEVSDDWVKKVRDSNYPFDTNSDGKITVGEFRQFIIRKYSSRIPDIS